MDRDLFPDDDMPPWTFDAACVGMSPHLFFPADESNPAEALAVCDRCPVRAPCLDMALSDVWTEGIWGGTTTAERRRLRSQRQAA